MMHICNPSYVGDIDRIEVLRLVKSEILSEK
jgi:hypothetical protein